jgi:hypothetical protein
VTVIDSGCCRIPGASHVGVVTVTVAVRLFAALHAFVPRAQYVVVTDGDTCRVEVVAPLTGVAVLPDTPRYH